MVFQTVSSFVVLVLFSYSWQYLDIIVFHQNNYPIFRFRSKESVTYYTNVYFIVEGANYWQNNLCSIGYVHLRILSVSKKLRLFFLKIYLFIFRQKGRESEKHQ